MTPLIELKDINLQYQNPVLQDISFSIQAGEYTGLVGPNGAGKSSLLKIILGIVSPTSGEVKKTSHLKIGYVPQSVLQDNPFVISVKEVMELALKRKSWWRKKDETLKFEEKLQWVGLSKDFLDKEFHTLSGGQQQRVIIAKALLDDPQLLLFDEPLSGVDYRSKLQIYQLLSEINKSHHTTILFVSHEVENVIDQCSRILCLDKTLYEGCHPIDFVKGSKQKTTCPIHHLPSTIAI